MKKLIIICLSLIVFTNVYADDNNKLEVSLVECQKASTYMINENGKIKRIKLIAFDGNAYDQVTLNNYVCNLVNKAKKIEIEYDLETKDEYNRYPVWVYLDGHRLQDMLISGGYGEVNYVEHDYNYLDRLCSLQKDAIVEKKGIWKTNNQEKYCQSGIEIKIEKQKKEKEEEEKKTNSYKYIYFILAINSLMLILLIILKMNYISQNK